jgi:hypothetical protein
MLSWAPTGTLAEKTVSVTLTTFVAVPTVAVGETSTARSTVGVDHPEDSAGAYIQLIVETPVVAPGQFQPAGRVGADARMTPEGRSSSTPRFTPVDVDELFLTLKRMVPVPPRPKALPNSDELCVAVTLSAVLGTEVLLTGLLVSVGSASVTVTVFCTETGEAIVAELDTVSSTMSVVLAPGASEATVQSKAALPVGAGPTSEQLLLRLEKLRPASGASCTVSWPVAAVPLLVMWMAKPCSPPGWKKAPCPGSVDSVTAT